MPAALLLLSACAGGQETSADAGVADSGVNNDETLQVIAGLEFYSNNGCAACHCNDSRGGCNLEAPNIQGLSYTALEANLRFATTAEEFPNTNDPFDPHPLKLIETTDEQLHQVEKFLKTLQPGTPIADNSFIGQGYNFYVSAGCIQCHLTSAQGSAQGGLGQAIAGTDPDNIYQALTGDVPCHPLQKEPPPGAGCSILGHYETNPSVQALTDTPPPDVDDQRVFLAYFLAFISPPPPAPGVEECMKTPGTICTIAGNGTGGFAEDGVPAVNTLIYYPQNIEIHDWNRDGSLDVVFSDWNNHRIRVVYIDKEIDGVKSPIASLAGTGKVTGDDALNHPIDLAFDASGALLIASWHNQNIYRYQKEMQRPKDRQQIAGLCALACADDTDLPQYVGDVPVALPESLAAHPDGRVFLAESACGRIQVLTSSSTSIMTWQPPECIGPINLRSGRLTRFAGKSRQFGYEGDGGNALDAKFNIVATPVVPNFGIALNPSGSRLYVSDSLNNVIRVIDTTANPPTINLFAGTPGMVGNKDGAALGEALFNFPINVQVDAQDRVYVADVRNNTIRRIDPATMRVETIAGTGRAGFNGDNKPALMTKLNQPGGVAIHPDGRIFIADTNNNRLRVIYP